MRWYTVRVQHDNGITRFRLVAKDRDAAIQNVMVTEGCPRSAILSARVAGGAGRWIESRHIPYRGHVPAIDYGKGV